MKINCVKLICPRCKANFHHPAAEVLPSTGTWPRMCPACTEAERVALIAHIRTVGDMLIHTEGDANGNKAKTSVLKFCPNVRDVMNANAQYGVRPVR